MKRPSVILIMFLTALLLTGWSVEAFAVSRAEISRRLDNQHARIKEGIGKGLLTKHEAEIVRNNLEWIEATYGRMKRDGRLTPRELDKMAAMLDRNGRMISKEIRDFEYVYWGNFEERIRDQRQRINDGIAERRLTRHEADIVLDNLEWIRTTFDRMKRDGRLKAGEMKRLDEMLDHNSEMIYKKKHNQDYFNFRVRFKDFR